MPLKIYPDPVSFVRPVSKIITVSKTRPADTTAYAAGDVISESTSAGTIWTFANVVRSAGLGALLQDAMLISSATQTTKLDADLYLFDTAPASTQNDNTAAAVSDAELKTAILVLPFLGSSAGKSAGANWSVELAGQARDVVCAAGSTSLYGMLIARNAYTPANAEELTLRLRFVQD